MQTEHIDDSRDIKAWDDCILTVAFCILSAFTYGKDCTQKWGENAVSHSLSAQITGSTRSKRMSPQLVTPDRQSHRIHIYMFHIKIRPQHISVQRMRCSHARPNYFLRTFQTYELQQCYGRALLDNDHFPSNQRYYNQNLLYVAVYCSNTRSHQARVFPP